MAGLFGTKPKQQAPKPAPTADDKQIQSARRRRVQLAQQRSGVASSVMSQPGTRETLG